MNRCGWANPNEPLYVAYHDAEWGVPCQVDGQNPYLTH